MGLGKRFRRMVKKQARGLGIGRKRYRATEERHAEETALAAEEAGLTGEALRLARERARRQRREYGATRGFAVTPYEEYKLSQIETASTEEELKNISPI